jgi:TonB family protein
MRGKMLRTKFQFGIVALVIASCFAQDTPQQPSPPANAENSSTASARGNVEVLGDTMGVDFGPYLSRILREIKANWVRQLPESALSGLRKGKLKIEFYMLRNGRSTGMALTDSSGDVTLDRSAWGAVTASAPFPPLPNEFGGQYLKLRITFRCNYPTVSISPSGRISVPAGSGQQFTAKTSMNDTVNSTVAGAGCIGEKCGTISATGLYTVPQTVPHPETVTVTATLASDPTETASAKVIIAQAPSP